jgi:protein-disulfide isomerase
MKAMAEPLGPEDHVLGRSDAAVTLVEYGDYQCPFCARAHEEIAEVVRRNGRDVRFAFRHFPLLDVHPHALRAAEAAEAAGAQGRFWTMHAILFENQDALWPEDLLVYAESLELDVRRLAAELRGDLHLPKVEHDLETGARSGINGTPTFFVNGYRYRGAADAESLTAAIRAVARPQPAARARHS